MKGKCTHILLDLDGTLVDSGQGVTESVRSALAYFGIREDNRERLNRFIGPPLKDSFLEFYGFTPEEADRAVVKYREHYAVKGIHENRIYEGIKDTLAGWRAEGKSLCVCTSKPELYARQILKELRLSVYFDFIGGATFDGTRGRKEEVMAYVLANLPENGNARIAMVGDRKFDIEAAKQMGLMAVGVLYGYGTRRELEAAGADCLAGSAAELAGLL